LNSTVAFLSSDTVGVVLSLEELTIAVAVNGSSYSSEVLSTVCWGFICSSAGDLSSKNVECLGCSKTTATISQSHGDGVCGCCPKFSVHVIASVGPTDRGRVHACLSSHGQGVVTRPCSRRGGESRESLEIQPQLTDVIGHLAEGVGAGGGTGGCVAAGVPRVPDVGGVGGDSSATGGGVDHTADSKASSTVTISTPSLSRALRAGVASSVGAGGT